MKIQNYISKSSILNNKSIILILGGAFLVRLIGIAHGYPYVFNIDEPALIRSTRGLFFNKYIGHFDWPHFNYYFNFVIFWLFIKFRAVLQILHTKPILEKFVPFIFDDPFSFYFLTRFTNAVLGTLTVFGVYKITCVMFKNTVIGKKNAGKDIALASSFIMAFMPYHVYISHIAIQETALLFWTVWSLYFAYMFSLSNKYKYLIISSIFLAFASGVKYNAVLMGIYSIFFIALNINNVLVNVNNDGKKSSRRSKIMFLVKVLFVYITVYLVTFFVTNYQIIKYSRLFWSYEPGRGFLWQLKINSRPITNLLDFINSIKVQTVYLIADVGYIPVFLIFIGILFVILSILKYYRIADNKNNKFYKKLREAIESTFTIHELLIVGAIILLTVLGVLFVMHYQRANSHYYVIYYWAIAVVAGYFSVILLKKSLVIYLFLFPLVLLSVRYDYLFLRKTTFNIALECYNSNKNKNDILFKGESISEVQVINNLKMKRFKTSEKVSRNDIVISEEKFNDGSLHLLKIIDNNNKFGPIIYVYTKN